MNTHTTISHKVLDVTVTIVLMAFLSGCSGNFDAKSVSASTTPSPSPSPTNQISTLAGSKGGSGAIDDTGADARFSNPTGVTSDGTYLYIADNENFTIRRITISTGAVTTLAGTAGVSGSSDGTGSAARFKAPYAITTDGTNLFVTDTDDNTIRQIVIATGVVTTLAGTAGASGSTDGTGAAARFNVPMGIANDGTNLYVADSSNHVIRQIVIATGVVTTLAGTAGAQGSTDNTGSAARFRSPKGVCVDGANLYVSDTQNAIIRQIVISTGVVTTLAGTAGNTGTSDGTGAAARFYSPESISSDGTNLFVLQMGMHTIRKIVIATTVVTTFAGSNGAPGVLDGTGSAARFRSSAGIESDGTNLYVADSGNHTVRKIVISSAAVTTFAGTAMTTGGSDGAGAAAKFNMPYGIAGDGTNLYVADAYNSIIRQIVIATGVVTTLAGTSGAYGSTDGTGAAANFSILGGITSDGTSLYVADTSNHTIRQIVIATGVVTTLAGTAGASGSTDGTGAAARFNFPAGVTTDGVNLYVVDASNYVIRQIVISTGVVTTLAGTAGVSGSSDGTGAAASFDGPNGIVVDGANLYVTEATNHSIRKIVIATGVVTTFAGTGSSGSADGTGTSASFNNPYGIATDGTYLYVTDQVSNTIRRIVIATGVVTTPYGSVSANATLDGSLAQGLLQSPYGITYSAGKLFFTQKACVREIQ